MRETSRAAHRRMLASIAAFTFALLFIAWPRVAHATPADDAFAEAQTFDAQLRFQDALTAYERARALDADGPNAERAAARIAILKSHSEGNFAPFSELEEMRRDPTRSRDGAAIDRLAHDAEAFPQGLVRVEAFQLCANAYATRLARPDAAVATASHILDDSSADALARTDAARIIVDVAVKRGDFSLAERAVRAVGVAEDLRAQVARLHRRRTIATFALGAVLLWILASATAAVRARRVLHVHYTRTFLKLTGVVVLIVACAGVLASRYDGASALPFFFLAIGVAIVAAGSAMAGRAMPRARLARATLSAAAVVAVAFLSLYAAGPDYLQDFGL